MNEIAEPVATRRASPVLDFVVDDQHPWIGLESFTEETRQFFFGREDEVAELARRVQRKTLAILFGQSGLGKTSILRAGIVPRLRREGFCPIYVRVDYSRESPAPSQQIKQAIFRATDALGKWTKPGTSVPGESLWEFLHHRDDSLLDHSGKPLTPLLIFDQFEEIFTLGQGDDFGRERAGEFIQDLADLVENRPPRALEMMLENEDTIVERFDFNRADYRILIALREDYLAHLESLKVQMPSITQNRMRLARMTGHQALAAVVKPGGRLVSEEVAESIVRFVAGGAELRNAEVEPSLLSLVCRELNNARLAQGRAEISADLLAGSRDTILHEFYERALVDHPARVRCFIEDEMLTESGFRESLAEERVLKGFAAANAMPSALPTLVNRRLLRIEERLDARRVELTHDVLCAVVKDSRDARHEREAREEMGRQLSEQREREVAARKAYVRVRQVAVGCGALAVVAVASTLFGYHNMQRVERTQAAAEAARSESEKLVVYLLDDFYLELEPVGRVEIMADLARRALAYYAGLPADLRTAETERNRALALVRYGFVMRAQAKFADMERALDEAIAVLAKLRAQGDRSETAAVGHAVALAGRARAVVSRRSADAVADSRSALSILEPVAAAASANAAARRARGYVATTLGIALTNQDGDEAGSSALDAAREAWRGVDGLKDDLAAAAGFVEAAGAQMTPLANLGRAAQARNVGEEAVAVATRVLEKRPGHLVALPSRATISAGLARVELWDLRFPESIALAQSAERDWEALLRLDPGSAVAWAELIHTRFWLAIGTYRLGRTDDALRIFRETQALGARRGVVPSPKLHGQLAFQSAVMAFVHAQTGRFAEAREDLARADRQSSLMASMLPPADFWSEWWHGRLGQARAEAAFAAGDYAAARDAARNGISHLEKVPVKQESQTTTRNDTLAFLHLELAKALLQLRDLAGAESAARTAMKHRALLRWYTRYDDLDRQDDQAMLALILARQGRLPEARAIVEPIVEFHGKLPPHAARDVHRQLQLALSMYVSALCDPARSASFLAETSRALDALPPEARRLHATGLIRTWMSERKGGA